MRRRTHTSPNTALLGIKCPGHRDTMPAPQEGERNSTQLSGTSRGRMAPHTAEWTLTKPTGTSRGSIRLGDLRRVGHCRRILRHRLPRH